MKTLTAATALVIAWAALAAVAQEEKETEKTAAGKTPQVTRVVVPMDDVHAFVVTGRSTHFRLPVSTIAGGTIGAPKITGQAKHLRTEEIIMVQEEGKPSIGSVQREYLFRATAPGTITIEFEKKLPTQPDPVLEKFTVTVK